jgi:hypothetical protein
MLYGGVWVHFLCVSKEESADCLCSAVRDPYTIGVRSPLPFTTDIAMPSPLLHITGVGSTYGLSKGRHVRINTPNIIKIPATQQFIRGPNVTGEGVYQCYNTGKLLSCVVPLAVTFAGILCACSMLGVVYLLRLPCSH